MVAVGIDLGTTNSCVAICKNGKVDIIQDDENYVIPSWVGFTENGIITGHEAKNEAHRNITNTIFEVKRLMGQRYSNEKVQQDIKKVPYRVVEDKGMTKIRVAYQDKEADYFPEEISAFILEKLKQLAEKHLNENVTNVVVTVPAYFNDFQRQATKDAAFIAGFQKVNIINEPTAAALAFNHQNGKNVRRNVMVYDFGGGTFDVSIVAISKGKCEVKATKGDSHLGGTDVNDNLVAFLKEDFKKRFQEDLTENEVTTRRLTARCEKTKEQLSTKLVVEIELNNLSGKDYFASITRDQFEKLNLELFRRTIKISEECLESSGLTKEEIDEIVLVGGSSRIPKVQEMIRQSFGEDKINKGVNPDEAVAWGAAIHATHLLGDKSEVDDVISLSLGIAVLNFEELGRHLSDTLIPCNSAIPTVVSKTYPTSEDNQEAVSIKVHQGEEEYAMDNYQLGNFVLSGLNKAPAGVTKMKVCFDIDADGILKVTASEIGAENSREIKIDVNKDGLSKEDVVRRVQEMEQHRKDENARREFVVRKYTVEKRCHKITKKATQLEDESKRTHILRRCLEIEQMLEGLSIAERNKLEEVNNELKEMKDDLK